MAKLIVSNDVSFSLESFYGALQNLEANDSTTLKADSDLWKVDFNSSGVAYVRGHDFDYDTNDTGPIADDVLTSGTITSFSFNGPGGDQALVKIRNLDDLSAAKVHDAIESGDPQDFSSVVRTAFKGDDVLKGANLQDYLAGFKGDDTIKAGAGSDLIIGGKGEDRLHGGDDTDQDVFVFANGDSGKTSDHADRVYDFVSGTDLINLGETGGDKSLVHIDHSGGNSTITLDAHDGFDKMVIVVVDNDQVHKSDLSFQPF